MHCHPTYLNAMTMIHELDEESFYTDLVEDEFRVCAGVLGRTGSIALDEMRRRSDRSGDS